MIGEIPGCGSRPADLGALLDGDRGRCRRSLRHGNRCRRQGRRRGAATTGARDREAEGAGGAVEAAGCHVVADARAGTEGQRCGGTEGVVGARLGHEPGRVETEHDEHGVEAAAGGVEADRSAGRRDEPVPLAEAGRRAREARAGHDRDVRRRDGREVRGGRQVEAEVEGELDRAGRAFEAGDAEVVRGPGDGGEADVGLRGAGHVVIARDLRQGVHGTAGVDAELGVEVGAKRVGAHGAIAGERRAIPDAAAAAAARRLTRLLAGAGRRAQDRVPERHHLRVGEAVVGDGGVR